MLNVKKAKLFVSAMLAMTLFLSLLSGCGGNGNSGGETALTELNVGIAQDFDSGFDPHSMTAAGTREALFNVYEGLVKPSSGGEMLPAVAASYEVLDGDTFVFTLREGIKFHDGSAVTVDDIVFSIERASGLVSGTALMPSLDRITEVRADDERTVTIKIAAPDIEFMANLTAAIVPASYDPVNDEAPQGTGPFKFESYTPQETLVIDRFDDYWGEKASLDRVNYKIIENPETLITSLRSGAIDFCAHLTYDQTKEIGDNFKIIAGSMNLVQALYLNNSVPPLDNMTVRQALSYALDRQQIMDVVANGEGFPVGSSMYPAFDKYFDASLVDYYDYNIEKARQLLEEAGYPDGFDLEITVPSSYTPHVDAATVLVSQLSEIGVRATIKLVDMPTWLAEAYTERKFQSTVIGVDASSLTARAMLERFQSENSRNFINFNSPDYDEVFIEAITATDDGEQVKLYKQLQGILTRDAASVYIQDLCDLVAMRHDIEGYTPYPLYVIDMAKLYINNITSN